MWETISSLWSKKLDPLQTDILERSIRIEEMKKLTDEHVSQIRRLDIEIKHLKRFAYPETETKNWSCFNPSIGYSPKKGFAIAFRSSNYVILETGELYVSERGKIQNKMFFAETNESLQLMNFREIPMPKELLPMPRGMEDPKLFWRDGTWHFTSVVMEQHTPVARLAVCKMNSQATKITSIDIHDGVDPYRPEKSWMVTDINPNEHFDFIYGPNAVVKGNKIIYTTTNNPIIMGLRGNTNLLEQSDGTYLAVMHKLWTQKSQHFVAPRFGNVEGLQKFYGHYLVRFDCFGNLIEMSKPFCFLHRGIEYAAGIVDFGDSFAISYGHEDVSSHVALLPKEFAFSMLEPVE